MHWTEQKMRAIPGVMRLVRALALVFPRWAVLPWAYGISLLFFLFSPVQRRASRHYLNQVLGLTQNRSANVWDVYRHFSWFGITILDRVYFLSGKTQSFQIDHPNEQVWKQAFRTHPAQLLLSAHFGSLDALRAFTVESFNIPLKVVLKVEHNEALVDLLYELNPDVREQILPYSGMKTIFDIHEALSNGTSVALLNDRRVGEEASINVRFFEDTLSIPMAGFKLAHRFHLPVMVFFCRYAGKNRYVLEGKILPESARTSLETMAQWYMDQVQTQCLKSPYNWFNFYPYWNSEKTS